MQRSRTAALLAVPLVALAGCGSVGERGDAAAAVAVGLLSAADAGDGAAVCAALAPDTLAEVEETGGKPCAQAVLDEDLPGPGTITTTDVYGQWARVVLSDDTVFLAAFPGGWRVVAAGCTARGERPYDCTLQEG
jgi:hypothetical protein